MKLQDGSRIGVIGGGPASSFFTWFLLKYSRERGINVHIDIIEPKDFTSSGPAGCNKCGGIVSESLIRMLLQDGIQIPSNVIRRDIESYTLHLEYGKAIIETPFPERSIASMFRGLGPRGPADSEHLSFDNFLLDLCRQQEVQVIHDTVVRADRLPESVRVVTGHTGEFLYDLVAGAVGLNMFTLEVFQSLCPAYSPPVITRTHISEIHMGKEMVDRYFGNSMHVFLLNLRHVKFGALIPKGNYVTLVLLGRDISRDVVQDFLSSRVVRDCFPPGILEKENTPCQCFPVINVRGARHPFDDRIVLIGDSASSKLYKNGLGAAYITGKTAASTAVFHGISRHDFRRWYQPVCLGLDMDNRFGKLIFTITSVIQRSGVMKKGLRSMVLKEQEKTGKSRLLSPILWDTFTGSASYAFIFGKSLNPVFLILFLWNMVKHPFTRTHRVNQEKL